MIYDFFVDLLRHLSLSLDFLKPYATFIGVLILLLRQNNIKKIINGHLPKRFRDTQSNDIYDTKKEIKIIHAKIDALLAKWGVVWHVEPNNSEKPHHGQKLRYGWTMKFRARVAKLFTARKVIDPLTLLRRMDMKNFLTGKKKWLAFLIAVAVNGLDSTLGLGLGAETVNNITQGATGYIVIEGALDFTRSLTDYFKSKGAKPNAELDIPIEPTL